MCGRPGTPAGSRRMRGDLHPWRHPCRHGCACAGGSSGGAPGTRPTRSTSAGLWMGVTWPVSAKWRPGTADRVGEVSGTSHHTTDASSVREPRPWGPPQAFPRHGGQACGCPVDSGCSLDSLRRVRRELHYRHRDAETGSTTAPGIHRANRRRETAHEAARPGTLPDSVSSQPPFPNRAKQGCQRVPACDAGVRQRRTPAVPAVAV